MTSIFRTPGASASRRHSRLRPILLCIPLLGAACGDDDGNASKILFDPDKVPDASLPVGTPDTQDEEDDVDQVDDAVDDEPTDAAVADIDAATGVDAGAIDASSVDAGTLADATSADSSAQSPDAGVVTTDAGDAGLSDAATNDSAVFDAATDAGANPGGDAGSDAGSDAGTDAGSDAGTVPASTDKLFVLTLSLTGHDRFYDVAYGADGSIFAVGQLASDTSNTADYSLLLAKFKPDGSLDTSFGNRGIVVRNVAVGGTSREIGRSVVVQSTGKVVIAGTVEHDPKDTTQTARDTDWVAVRFTTTGALDSTFGTKGIAQIDLSTGYPSVDGTEISLLGRDQLSTMAVTPDDALILHGTSRAAGLKASGDPRTDTDTSVVKLTKDGLLDASFGTAGVVSFDVGLVDANPRDIFVHADGKIISTGYATTGVIGVATQQAVVCELDGLGAPVPSYAASDVYTAPGCFHDFLTAADKRFTAYAAAEQEDGLVLFGYGANATTTTDFLFSRLGATGVRDLTFGTNGITYVDGGGYSDTGRGAVILPGQHILGVGQGRPKPAVAPTTGNPPADGMLVLLTRDGSPDDSFAPKGTRFYDFGGPGDSFYSANVSPDENQLAVVGIKTSAVSGGDDDSVLMLVKLPLTK